MSNKRHYKLVHAEARRRAALDCQQAPDGWVVTVSEPTRNGEQNSKFHAICSDVARQAEFMGKKRTALQWKVLFISGHAMATGIGAEIVPGLEGEFVNIRESSASMSVKRMCSLIEYVLAWCSDKDVRFSEGYLDA